MKLYKCRYCGIEVKFRDVKCSRCGRKIFFRGKKFTDIGWVIEFALIIMALVLLFLGRIPK